MFLRVHTSNRLRIVIINDDTGEEDCLLQICKSIIGREPTPDEIASRQLKPATNSQADFLNSEEGLAMLEQLLAMEKPTSAHKPQKALLGVFTASTKEDFI